MRTTLILHKESCSEMIRSFLYSRFSSVVCTSATPEGDDSEVECIH